MGSGLEAGLQAVQRTGGAGGSGGFTDVDGEIDAAVDGVVVLVRRRGLAGVLPPSASGIIVRVVNEGNTGCGVINSKLGMRHKIMNRCFRVRFFQAFVEGTTECIHNSNLLETGEERKTENHETRCFRFNRRIGENHGLREEMD